MHLSNPNKNAPFSVIESQTTDDVKTEAIVDWGNLMIAVHYPSTPNEKINQQLSQYANDLVNQFKSSAHKNGYANDELYVSFTTHKSGEFIIGFKFDIIERRTNNASRNEVQKISFNLKTGDRVVFEDYFDENNQPIIAQIPNNIVTPEDTENKKLVALTFDDGPHSRWTNELLDVLQEENVPATFFVLGSRASRYPDLVRRAFDSGHQIGSHTFNHKDLTKLPQGDIDFEIGESAAVIERITGQKPAFTRPPYGAVNQAVQDTAKTPLIMWSVDPEDWKSQNIDQIFTHVMDNTKDGSIVLLHDIYGTTIEAVKKIIPEMRQRNFVFLTVQQLMAARGKNLENGSIYYQAAP
jgi:peptidoglycan/xylan/chitin deacetylase (PgdA/CDA1 family)